MSEVSLAEVKADLRVIHSGDDALLQQLIDAAEGQVLRFTGRTQLPTLPLDYPPEYDSNSSEIPEDEPSSEDPIAPEVRQAVFILVRSKYEALEAAEIVALTEAAESLLFSFRVGLGV